MQSTENDWNGPWVDVKPPQLLIVSIPLIHSEWATVHCCRVYLPTHHSHVETQHSSSDTVEPYPPAMKLLFTIKPAVILKEEQKSHAIWKWSKIDLKHTLMAWDTYRSHYYCNMTKDLSLLDWHIQHRHARRRSETFLFSNRKFRQWSEMKIHFPELSLFPILQKSECLDWGPANLLETPPLMRPDWAYGIQHVT